MSDSGWGARHAPSMADLEALAEEAFARLPDAFRALCGNLAIRVEEFAEDDVLTELGAEDAFDVLGLFTGVGLVQAGAVPATGALPNLVLLYRRPILDYWAEHEETLGGLVAHVLIHEIGHHLGFSDEDLERIEGEAE